MQRSRPPSLPPAGAARRRGAGTAPASVPAVLHPVGDLPAAVYWRRRLVVLAVLVGLLAGTGWLVTSLVQRADADAPAEDEASSSPVPTPALERVLPSLAGVRTPEKGPAPPLRDEPPAPAPRATGAAPTPGRPCTDEMVEVALRAPRQVPAGSKPTLEIVVRNVAAVPCVRAVDEELQEILLLDAAGTRVWGSNDCFRERSDRRVTLQPGGRVALPIVWGGLTSAPRCAGERVVPPAGDYALRARLDTKASADAPIRLI